jgi:hypothetical protein
MMSCCSTFLLGTSVRVFGWFRVLGAGYVVVEFLGVGI